LLILMRMAALQATAKDLDRISGRSKIPLGQDRPYLDWLPEVRPFYFACVPRDLWRDRRSNLLGLECRVVSKGQSPCLTFRRQRLLCSVCDALHVAFQQPAVHIGAATSISPSR